MHLDGQIDGDIRCDALTLGEHSVVCGDILVDSLVAHGRISGQVVARTVRFGPTARLRGDVTYASLGIEAGAEIDGRFIHRNPADAAVPAAPAVAKLFAVDGD